MAASIEVVHQVERVIFKCTFNRMGALQLDKEFRQLTSYLTTVAGWSFREKIARLSQVCINRPHFFILYRLSRC